MDVHDVFSAVGGILTIALVAVILTKPNTAGDINASGMAFTGALKEAEAG
jgi:hypothetical protein